MDRTPRKRKVVTSDQLDVFLRQYGRTSRRNGDPNDRGYSRDIERRVQAMSAEELDRLLRDDDVDCETSGEH